MSERENLMFGCSGESDFNLVTRCRQEMDEPEGQNLHFEEFVSEEGNFYFLLHLFFKDGLRRILLKLR